MRSQCYVRRWLTSPASSAHTVGDRMETTDDDIHGAMHTTHHHKRDRRQGRQAGHVG